ncbi:HsdM N-terminal domain-containing protein [Desulfofustis glycolicus DSM 9705]|uniref:HsdM N-terminal domain-containing protein n=1 Tax=Desulfofustis glycolicus DSM 9705 TaxID=1121409 RepID=A0A1M5Y7G8_9BACT|nr:HsdM N-terminal domain-containing protein [Desulfofustis glycolicus DSM 9705]
MSSLNPVDFCLDSGVHFNCLRDIYVRGKYRDVILPMFVLRRLDCLLEPSKDAVMEEAGEHFTPREVIDPYGDPIRTAFSTAILIDWLIRKPGAFANYRYRSDLFPTSPLPDGVRLAV